MGYRFGRDDVAYLGSAAGRAALTEVDRLELTPATHLRDIEQVRRSFGDQAAALIETVRLRRRAVVKLPAAADWLFTDDALQQATPALVARHRAARLAGRPVHDVTCSIGAELAELSTVCPVVIGSDLDEVRLAMAAHNLGVAPLADFGGAGVAPPTSDARHRIERESRGLVAGDRSEPDITDTAARSRNILLATADALTPISKDTVIIADPARRADGRRTYDPAKLQPPLPDLLTAYAGRDIAVKSAPGLDFDRLGWDGEVEIVSLDGAVREACLWSPGLSDGITRRATVLDSRGAAITLTDADPDGIPERAPGDWIIDPDGAIVRAGLVRHYAAKHGLWQLDPHIAYLTGDTVPPGVRGFRIEARFDLREKTLRQELARRDCGALEILVRGIDIDPDALRKKLKLRGTRPYTLVITRVGRAGTVFLCTAHASKGHR
ncbi:THUMP-like domain-containing protein [Nocardia mangyaensis]|uniref:THUMP-like domain-containing protein n=1 Tax=Nocardia mangyaensis TaxID=2213200 RepID=UPI0026771AFE|nr:class I SAM-dependent methyltransferase [Nocardia mangyaensis]MDO3645804.1 class I SAM-dependent methyltransferase [Nocardia mangyaensis]